MKDFTLGLISALGGGIQGYMRGRSMAEEMAFEKEDRRIRSEAAQSLMAYRQALAQQKAASDQETRDYRDKTFDQRARSDEAKEFRKRAEYSGIPPSPVVAGHGRDFMKYLPETSPEVQANILEDLARGKESFVHEQGFQFPETASPYFPWGVQSKAEQERNLKELEWHNVPKGGTAFRIGRNGMPETFSEVTIPPAPPPDLIPGPKEYLSKSITKNPDGTYKTTTSIRRIPKEGRDPNATTRSNMLVSENRLFDSKLDDLAPEDWIGKRTITRQTKIDLGSSLGKLRQRHPYLDWGYIMQRVQELPVSEDESYTGRKGGATSGENPLTEHFLKKFQEAR